MSPLIRFKTVLAAMAVCAGAAAENTAGAPVPMSDASQDAQAQAAALERLGERIRPQLLRRGLALQGPRDNRRTAQAAVRSTPVAIADAQDVRALGLMVRWRSSAAEVLQGGAPMPSADALARVAGAAGVQLTYRRAMGGGWQVLRFATPQQFHAAMAMAERIQALPDIEAVEPDTQVRVQLLSSDPLARSQWNMAGPEQGFAGGIGAQALWDYTVGLRQTVVAVVDTGVVPHPEFSARLLPGYDFISTSANANDGDGRDANAADPGDWATAGLCGAGEKAENSSWHGTHVSGIIGADGANGIGLAGVNWNTRLLPVRVLGRCGGAVSDIVDGIRWAAGLTVPGAPKNNNPAQVINLSLGGLSPNGCSRPYQEAVNAALGQGALVVVAAGNSAQNFDNYTPANCQGVLTVVAVDPFGDLASYSNFSFKGRVAAPGGDINRYGNAGGIWSTVASGTTTPTGYTWGPKQGTSMAAPHVSGIASMALAVNPNLSGAELVFLLDLASAPFPASSTCKRLDICGTGIASALLASSVAAVLADFQLVYEFRNVDLNHYFRTGAKAEAAIVNRGGAGAGWFDTLDYFYGWTGPIDGALPVCRFYGTPGKGPNSHFYTASAAECDLVKKDPGWTYEGTAFYAKLPVNGACATDDVPVYRVYNGRWRENDSNHRYTTSLTNYNAMVAKGWLPEGITMCAAF